MFTIMQDDCSGCRKTKPTTCTLTTIERHDIRDTRATYFQDGVCSGWKTSIGNCNDKCSTDRFPNASCLNKPYENQIYDMFLKSQIETALEHWPRTTSFSLSDEGLKPPPK